MLDAVYWRDQFERSVQTIFELTMQLANAQAEIERLRAAAVGANAGAVNRLIALASDVRWEELAEGAFFTMIDRSMLRDLCQAALSAGAAVRADETSDEKSADASET